MGTVIDQIAVSRAGWRHRHSAFGLAVKTARACLRDSGRDARDVDLLINVGIYRDRNLGEPALAAMIQEDIGANPEDPHANAHGTFSFDIANGTCGLLSALQIVDGFLASKAIDCALVVASDADPGHRMSENFPFSPAGAALLCHWTEDDYGLRHVQWANTTDGGETFSATVGLVDRRNVLRFDKSTRMDERFAETAARAAWKCLGDAGLSLSDVDAIAVAPACSGFRSAIAGHLDVPSEQISVAEDVRMHTASLAVAFDAARRRIPPGGQLLIIVAGAGITAGAALYRLPARAVCG